VNDHPQIDFSKLEGNPLVSFAHKNGFIAKTDLIYDKEDLIALISLSIRK